MCVQCLGSGWETETHKNNHSYYITDKFKMNVFDSEWTVREEFSLIYKMMHLGCAWSDIEISGKSSLDLLIHFYQYIYNFTIDGLTNLTQNLEIKSVRYLN